MAKAAHFDELRAAFAKHADETEIQIERLDEVFAMMGPHGARPARPSTDSWTKARRS